MLQNWFPNRKRNYPRRKKNYFSNCQVSAKKASFTRCHLFLQGNSKFIFKTGNSIIQIENRIISPTSRCLIKQAQNLCINAQVIKCKQNRRWKYPNRKHNHISFFQVFIQKLPKQEIKSFLTLQDL